MSSEAPVPNAGRAHDAPPPGDVGPRSMILAEQLQGLISSGDLAVGDSFPAERDLMVQYDVSRATVREALRMLGAKGLLEVRRGRRGGSYVKAPDGENVRSTLELFIQGHNIRFVDLLAVREAIEPVAAAQAARYRTAEDLEQIDKALDEADAVIEDIARFSELNVTWHMGIVRASHNPLFQSFMASISAPLYSATSREEFDLETRRIVARSHRRITDAIRDRDADAARRRMLRHVTSYGEELVLDGQAKPLGTAQ
ncbi:FadR/GntR family transcriptional regulator [Paracoccus pantotrophus]|uniref:FadR/GntR family transcriptional regulator n=1 Tax=Paracoccus pantotrophus TaxID=82367 RepID=UPI0004B57290|nr:FadR/GntR family transcriptional regulator [Paracoccus pantotrophus]